MPYFSACGKEKLGAMSAVLVRAIFVAKDCNDEFDDYSFYDGVLAT
ncbi:MULTISPECIES: hypothetical protein [unclassified Campylobacter]